MYIYQIISNIFIYIYIYISSLYKIINDTSKFLKHPSDPSIGREGKLQRLVLTLSKKSFFSRGNSMKTYILVVHN